MEVFSPRQKEFFKKKLEDPIHNSDTGAKNRAIADFKGCFWTKSYNLVRPSKG